MFGLSLDLMSLKLCSLVTCNAEFSSAEELNSRPQWNINILGIYSILAAIPRHWKAKSQNNTNLLAPYCITINESSKEISKVYSKDVYWELVKAKVKQPTAITTWIDLYPFLESCNWKSVFTLAYQICKEPYLQTFQYKVLNRTINCKYNLLKWHISDSDNCIYCEAIDTIEHHLYYCPKSLKFWDVVKLWLHDITKVKFDFTICEVIFGIPLVIHDPSNVLITFNFIILLGKWYINYCRCKQKQIDSTEYKYILKNKLETLKMAYTLNNSSDAFTNIFGLVYNKLII